IMLAGMYGLYAFGYALLNPDKAPPVSLEAVGGEIITRSEAIRWFVLAPVAIIGGVLLAGQIGLVGSQNLTIDSYTDAGQTASLRTRVSEQCKASMIELHGQEAWDAAAAQQAEIDAAGGVEQSHKRSDAEIAQALQDKIADAAPVGTGVAVLFTLAALLLALARGVSPSADPRPLMIGAAGILLGLIVDTVLIAPTSSSGEAFVYLALPFMITLFGCGVAAKSMAHNDLIRVVFPPLVLIVAVLGSILGGITNPTPAAALGAGGALLLAAYRKLHDQQKSGAIILLASFSIIVMILMGINFDLRINRSDISMPDQIAYYVTRGLYFFSMFGILYACWVLLRNSVLGPVVRETAKVTSMVFTILIGSQILNLVLISFGGEHYIQSFLRSFEQEWTAFLIVMLVLFVLGFVLDFLEIIYIVVPIVGPVIYGGTYDPSWVTIMITVNLQTSFLTPPFGFALFYLRGVAPASVTTGMIYRGIIPFVLIQVIGLAILWAFPGIVTIVPDLLPNN
ncbi:MAG: TRAP transporter large permease subunit, partial [Albidovulum sp.]|uniref:TRAP transporter large permease subunit n=1 Tax=Albidovulum sp. TaxID=1872424 RepID=UPI003CBAC390